MANRIEDAVNKKMSGYNCAQAVACAFKDYVDVSEDELKKITQGFCCWYGNYGG